VSARREFDHVRWIGGAPGGGKSTMARALAARHGWRVYATDDVMADHGRRTSPQEAPLLAAFAAMDMDQRWLTRSPAEMLETFHWYRGEAFERIVEDLREWPSSLPVVVEGFRLLPHLVRPLLTDLRQAVWLLPTPAFRRAALESRGDLWTIAAKTSDPPRALRNLLERDRRFTEQLGAEVARLGLHAIHVDETLTEPLLLERVEAALRGRV
jgi:hypothetical protein